MSDSDLVKKRDAIPEKRTGVENIDSARSEAMGFARWCLDRPMLRMLARDLLWLTILLCMWGRFPVRAHYTDMFHGRGKWNGGLSYSQRREKFDILDIICFLLGENKELCLAGRKLYLVLFTVYKREVKQ